LSKFAIGHDEHDEPIYDKDEEGRDPHARDYIREAHNRATRSYAGEDALKEYFNKLDPKSALDYGIESMESEKIRGRLWFLAFELYGVLSASRITNSSPNLSEILDTVKDPPEGLKAVIEPIVTEFKEECAVGLIKCYIKHRAKFENWKQDYYIIILDAINRGRDKKRDAGASFDPEEELSKLLSHKFSNLSALKDRVSKTLYHSKRRMFISEALNHLGLPMPPNTIKERIRQLGLKA